MSLAKATARCIGGSPGGVAPARLASPFQQPTILEASSRGSCPAGNAHYQHRLRPAVGRRDPVVLGWATLPAGAGRSLSAWALSRYFSDQHSAYDHEGHPPTTWRETTNHSGAARYRREVRPTLTGVICAVKPGGGLSGSLRAGGSHHVPKRNPSRLAVDGGWANGVSLNVRAR